MLIHRALRRNLLPVLLDPLTPGFGGLGEGGGWTRIVDELVVRSIRRINCGRDTGLLVIPVVAEIPDAGENDRRTDSEGCHRTEDRERDDAGDHHDRQPYFLRPSPNLGTEEFIGPGLRLAVLWNQQPAGEIEHHTDPAAQGQHGGANTDERGVDTPVPA